MRELFEYRWKYILSKIVGIFYLKAPAIVKKVCFVTRTDTKGWILDAKCRRLSRGMSLETQVFYSNNFKKLPKADGYFFAHYKYFAKAMRYNPSLWKKKTIVMFTHPSWNKAYSANHVCSILKKAYKVICLNKAITKELNHHGLPAEKMLVYHMASNPGMFTYHERGGGKVGFCMNYYDRKNPDLVYDIVTNMPEKEFILIGSNWEQYEKFDKLLKLSNFKYCNGIDYKKYPKLYHEMDVFVSPSFLEGGPVPLLEAMLSNVVPVVSNTGFCPDLVEHGKNGFLFETGANCQEVIELINKAFLIDENVRKYAVEHSWDNYAKKIEGLYLA